MKKNLLIITFSFLAFTFVNAQEVISIEAKGNLESPKPLSCVSLSEVKNEHNPADLLIGMKKCIELKDFKNAARLFAIAGVFGKYDSYRVKDKSAHQALLVLQQNVILNLGDTEKNALVESIKKELSETDSLNEICGIIRKIGAPKYFPTYMVQHGIQAFLEQGGNGLNENFDSQVSWNLALKSYLHCGE